MSKYFTFFSWHIFGQIPKTFKARKALKIFEILNTIFVNRYFSNFSSANGPRGVHDTCVHYCGLVVTYHVIHVLNSEDNSNKIVEFIVVSLFSQRPCEERIVSLLSSRLPLRGLSGGLHDLLQSQGFGQIAGHFDLAGHKRIGGGEFTYKQKDLQW